MEHRLDAALPPHVDAVLFDMDDTLVDSERAWSAAAQRLWNAYGVHTAPVSIPGGTVADLVNALARVRTDLDHDDATDLYLALLDEELGTQARPMPGAVELMNRLDPSVPVAVASNSPSAVVRRTVAALGWSDRVSAALGTDDVAAPKPAPDLYREAARRCRARISRCVVFEDSAVGAQAAMAAGAFVVVIGDAQPRHLRVSSLLDPLVSDWRPHLSSASDDAGRSPLTVD